MVFLKRGKAQSRHSPVCRTSRPVAERAGRDRAHSGHASGGGRDIPAAPGEHGRRTHLRVCAQLRRAGGREEHVQRRHPEAVLEIGTCRFE